MKKRLSILFCVVTIAFGIFSYSTNSLAIGNEVDSTFEKKKDYKDGEIISETNTLHADTSHEVKYENGEIAYVSDNLYDTPENRIKYSKYPKDYLLYEVKTISKYYSSAKLAKEESEYYKSSDDRFLYKAELEFKGIERFGNGFMATYSGRVAVFPVNNVEMFLNK